MTEPKSTESEVPKTELELNNINECIICAESMKTNDNIQWLQCLHKFHEQCLTKWLKIKQECPICKFSTKFEIINVNDKGEYVSNTGQIIKNGEIKSNNLSFQSYYPYYSSANIELFHDTLFASLFTLNNLLLNADDEYDSFEEYSDDD